MFLKPWDQHPEDADEVGLWNDIKVYRIAALEFLTSHVIGNPDLSTARDLVTAIIHLQMQIDVVMDLKVGELKANAASSDLSYVVGRCFNCTGPHLNVNSLESKNTCKVHRKTGHRHEFCDQISKMRTNIQTRGDKTQKNIQRNDVFDIVQTNLSDNKYTREKFDFKAPNPKKIKNVPSSVQPRRRN